MLCKGNMNLQARAKKRGGALARFPASCPDFLWGRARAKPFRIRFVGPTVAGQTRTKPSLGGNDLAYLNVRAVDIAGDGSFLSRLLIKHSQRFLVRGIQNI